MSTITITEAFPGLAAVNARLYPEAQAERPTIEAYAAGLEAQGHLTPAVGEAIEKAKVMRSYTDCVVYIAGALTGVSEESKARYVATSKLLAGYPPLADDSETQAFFGYAPHLHGTDPVKHPNVTPQEVRDIDHLWSAIVADLHINFLEPTAHGNAIETAWAESRLIPTIYLNPRGNSLSRLTKGMHNVIETIEYDATAGSQAGLNDLELTLDELHKWMNTFPDRDPREFHYTSFKRLANSAALIGGHALAPTLSITEFKQRFDPADFAVYVRSRGDMYGRLGRIAGMHEYTGVVVVTQDGMTRLFDPTSLGALSFWPINRSSHVARSLQAVPLGELPDPE